MKIILRKKILSGRLFKQTTELVSNLVVKRLVLKTSISKDRVWLCKGNWKRRCEGIKMNC